MPFFIFTNSLHTYANKYIHVLIYETTDTPHLILISSSMIQNIKTHQCERYVKYMNENMIKSNIFGLVCMFEIINASRHPNSEVSTLMLSAE